MWVCAATLLFYWPQCVSLPFLQLWYGIIIIETGKGKVVSVDLLGSNALKINTVCSSETLTSTFHSTLRFNSDDQHRIFTAIRTSYLI
jgi:hypothetical protein